jgi:SAM-dependent methyltransferase
MLGFLKLHPPQIDTKELDDPSTTIWHGKLILRKRFMRKFYEAGYNLFRRQFLPNPQDKVLVEIGAGAGFIKQVIPNVITTDVMPLPELDQVFSATEMPFANNSVDGFFMLNVFHHIKDCEAFLREAQRCLKVGGKIVMVEPADTTFSRYFYQHFHHENFDPTATEWQFDPEGGPLSSANGALPCIVFQRDRHIFQSKFPELKVLQCYAHSPLVYILSGGLSYRQFLPGFMYEPIRVVEWLLSPLHRWIGMFTTIVIEKQP